MKSPRLAASLLAALLVVGPGRAFTQNAPATPVIVPMQTAEATWRAIPVRNVPASFLAYWLDPAHNQVPPALRNSFGFPNDTPPANLAFPATPDAQLTKPQITGKLASGFDLPGAIELVVAFEPQRLLLVKGGNDADFRRLQELTTFLDQPLRQVEIEAQFVEISPDDLESVSGVFATNRGDLNVETKDSAIQIGFVRGNFQAKLDELIAAGKAKVITAPRVTAINNLEAELGLGEMSLPPSFKGLPTEKVLMKVIPTINGDDTLTLLLNAPANANSGGIRAVVNVRDGDTIVLRGIGSLLTPNGVKKIPRETVAFVTARIVRRADEMK